MCSSIIWYFFLCDLKSEVFYKVLKSNSKNELHILGGLEREREGGYSGVNFGHLKCEIFWGGYSGVNFGHLKCEIFWGGYFGVNFAHLKSEVFQKKGGWYSGVNFGHLKCEVFLGGNLVLVLIKIIVIIVTTYIFYTARI